MWRKTLRTARANRVFCTDEKRIRTEHTVIDKSKKADWGGFYTRSSMAHGCAFHPCAIDDPRGRFFVRAGFRNTLHAARANHVFCSDKKRIRTENTVIEKSKGGLGQFLYKIESLK
jgi:hypothetical protein